MTEVMDKLGDWYFDDSNEDCGQNLFNKFATDHMHLLPDECDPKKVEQTMQMTKAHEDYCDLFEAKMDEIIKEVNPDATAEQFVEAMQTIDSKETILEIILSLVDY